MVPEAPDAPPRGALAMEALAAAISPARGFGRPPVTEAIGLQLRYRAVARQAVDGHQGTNTSMRAARWVPA